MRGFWTSLFVCHHENTNRGTFLRTCCQKSERHPECFIAEVNPCYAEKEFHELCCPTGASSIQPIIDGCFDAVYTAKECCSGGRIRVFFPDLRAAPLRPDLALVPDSTQALFQWVLSNASVIDKVVLDTGVRVKLRFLRELWQESAALMEELKDDVYGLNHLEVIRRRDGPWAVDIGANAGFVTVALLKQYPNLKMIVVEPSPILFRFLIWNLRLNGVADRCLAFNVGIYSPILSSTTKAHFQHYQVPMVSFSNVLSWGPVKSEDFVFLKVDCEGCEWGLQSTPGLWERIDRHEMAVSAEIHMPSEGIQQIEWQNLKDRFCSENVVNEYNPGGSLQLALVCTRNIF